MGNSTNEAEETVMKWFKCQKNLPNQIEPALIKQFLIVCDYDLEKTKKLMETNYSLRNANPHIFLDRDPCSQKALNQLEHEATLILPGLTPEGNKVTILKLDGSNPIDTYDFDESIRLFFLMLDSRVLYDDPVGQNNGEVTVFDMNGYSLRLLMKSNVSTIRILVKFVQEAMPKKLKQIHVINALPLLDKVMMLVKPFMKKELYNSITIHQPNSETIFKFIPKEMFPQQYGGKAGNIDEIKKQWIDRMQSNREYLMDQNYWKIDVNKKLYSCRQEENHKVPQKLSLN